MSDPPSHVRQLTRDQVAVSAEALRELLDQALIGTITATAIADVATEITITLANAQTLRTAVTYIAETDGHLAGVLFGDVQGMVGFIRWVAVTPDQRRRGIGSALVDAFEAHNDVSQVQGMVHLDDPAATNFWVGRGWGRTQSPRRCVLMGSVTPIRSDAA